MAHTTRKQMRSVQQSMRHMNPGGTALMPKSLSKGGTTASEWSGPTDMIPTHHQAEGQPGSPAFTREAVCAAGHSDLTTSTPTLAREKGWHPRRGTP